MRYLLQAPVAFCWIDRGGATRHGEGYTRNVSTKGICISSAVSLPLGTSVAMNIDIPLPRRDVRSVRVEIQGRVVRFESAGIRHSLCIQYDQIVCPE